MGRQAGKGRQAGNGGQAGPGPPRDPIVRLAETLCARLCHDLSGPLSTIAAAVDMAIDKPANAADPLLLAQEAAGQMVARLRLMRAAWSGECDPIDASGLAKLVKGLSPRVTVELDGLTGEFPATQARILINLMLLAIDALPRGGAISLAGAAGGDVMVMAAGPHAAWPATLASALADPTVSAWDDPRGVQAPLVVHMAQEAGMRLSMLFAPNITSGIAPLLLTGP